MLIVEITVPSLGRNYDFELDESTAVETLTMEIVEVICQKEHCRLKQNEQKTALYHKASGTRLPGRATLTQCGIKNGQELLLV